jgi:hypothetical protein
MNEPKMSKGDAAAWKHAMESGLLQKMAPLLTDEEKQRIVLVALRTAAKDDRAAVPETELEALLSWALKARIGEQMLRGVLQGNLDVRMRDGEPAFSLTEKGEREARGIAREIGLPVPDEDSNAAGGTQ